jgi:hypothetical protein
VKRVLAGVGGAIVLALALLMSVGSAALALLVLGVAVWIQHARGQRLGVFPALWVAIISMTLVALVGAGLLVAKNGGLAKQTAAMAESEKRPPPPPPAWIRDLPGGNIPPPPMPAAMNGPLFVFSLFLMSQMFGALLGSLTWAGVWLIRYAVRGSFSEESVPPAG